ncbi:hypothetical protein M900_2776 [Bacteriovorax sp. Seq25_V]|nr:hypothetical protein M900_2776 [Bacteriovorax sp. Seq25_V]
MIVSTAKSYVRSSTLELSEKLSTTDCEKQLVDKISMNNGIKILLSINKILSYYII